MKRENGFYWVKYQQGSLNIPKWIVMEWDEGEWWKCGTMVVRPEKIFQISDTKLTPPKT